MNVLVLYIGAIILFIWGIAQEVERANVKGQSPMVTIRPTLSTAEPGWRNLYRIGGAAALLQLAAVLTYAIATAILGPKPTSAVEFFAVQQRSALEAVLRSDFQLIAAGEAVIASDMWNSSGAYVGGILMQGGGVIISLVMLHSRDFSRVTAVSGLLGNSLDLAQHILHPFAPGLSATLQMFMGPFYIVWFAMLARDFFRLARRDTAAHA
jgi:hypothetical protein